ncbi:universal stress protein [Arthrobacter sp. UYCu723]
MDATATFLIVVGVDGSEQSLAALHWAVDEARVRHGRVRLITAWHYPPVPSTIEDSGSNDSFHAAERVQADALNAVAAEGMHRPGCSAAGK